MIVRIKVCCIASPEEVRAAVAAGASAVGLVSAMPSGPGVLEEARIGAIARAVPPGVTSVLLTSSTDPDAIVDQQRRCAVDALQLCDALPPGAHAALRAALPSVALIQVIHVRDERSIEEALGVAPRVDALLLDSGRPDGAVKELGGTGRVHDWAISRRIRERTDVPVFLAGGLTPANVAAAIAAVEPYAVDVCSGLWTDGRLNAGKLAAFARTVREAS